MGHDVCTVQCTCYYMYLYAEYSHVSWSHELFNGYIRSKMHVQKTHSVRANVHAIISREHNCFSTCMYVSVHI